MKENETIADPVRPDNRIGLPRFHESTERWKQTVTNNNGMLDNVILAEHFDIPLSDLKNLVHEMEIYNKKIVEDGGDPDHIVHCIRGFMATMPYQNNSYKMDLYLTGVNADREPIYYFNGHSAIYDFILACPPTCQGVVKAPTE